MTFDMSAAWRDATAMITANREVLMIVAGIFFFLPALASGFSLPALPQEALADPARVQGAMGAYLVDYWWAFLLVAVLQIVGTLALLALLRGHGRPTVGEAIRTGLSGLLPALGASLLVAIGLFVVAGLVSLVIGLLVMAMGGAGGMLSAVLVLVLVIGFAYAWVRVSLATPVIAVDKVNNPVRVLRRSWGLTRGNVGRLLVFYLLLVVVYVVISLVVGLILGALGLALGELVATILDSLVSGLLDAIATVVFVAVLAAVHRQLSGPWGAAAAAKAAD